SLQLGARKLLPRTQVRELSRIGSLVWFLKQILRKRRARGEFVMIGEKMSRLLATGGAGALSVPLAAPPPPFPSPRGGIRFFCPVVSTTDGSSGLPSGLSTYSTIAWGSGSDAGVTSDLSLAPSFTQIPGSGPNADKSALQVLGHSGTINVGQTVVLSELFHR